MAGQIKQMASELRGLEIDHSSTKKNLNDFQAVVARLGEAPSANDIKKVNSRLDDVENRMQRLSK